MWGCAGHLWHLRLPAVEKNRHFICRRLALTAIQTFESAAIGRRGDLLSALVRPVPARTREPQDPLRIMRGENEHLFEIQTLDWPDVWIGCHWTDCWSGTPEPCSSGKSFRSAGR